VADPENNKSDQLSSGGISAMVFFYLWTAFYTPSWNGTPWVYNAEMFPQNVRTLGQAFAAGSNWVCIPLHCLSILSFLQSYQ
jgi:hypothetical protein